MKQYFDVIGITGNDEKHFIEIGNREGIRMHALKMSRPIAPLNDVIALWKLFWLLKKEKPQIIHTHTPKAGFLGITAAWLARVPIRLHTVAGLPLTEAKGGKRILLDIIERTTYKLSTKVYPNSHGLQEIILENKYCSINKLKVLGNGSSNGIDTNFFSKDVLEDNSRGYRNKFSSKWNIAPNDFIFCFVGRLAKEKGINELVNAFLELKKEYDKFDNALSLKLLLVGPLERQNGALDQKTEEVIHSEDNIVYVGRHDDIRPFLAISNMFVFPSYREGFPNVVMQAGAMGLPCIVSDINGSNEIIKNGENGIIVPVKDSSALTIAMINVLSDQKLLERLSSNSRRMIVDRYQQSIIWNDLLKEYLSFQNS